MQRWKIITIAEAIVTMNAKRVYVSGDGSLIGTNLPEFLDQLGALHVAWIIARGHWISVERIEE